jgi:hypothetical protein
MPFISKIKRIMGIREIFKLKNTPEFMAERDLFRVKNSRLEIYCINRWKENSCHLDEKRALRCVHIKLVKAMEKMYLTSVFFIDMYVLKDILLKSATIELTHEGAINKYKACFNGEKVCLEKVESNE